MIVAVKHIGEQGTAKPIRMYVSVSFCRSLFVYVVSAFTLLYPKSLQLFLTSNLINGN